MKPRKIPMRMCVGCREMKPKKELLRVVKSPEGEVSIDLIGKKPGRGVYLCAGAGCFEKAIKTRQIERAFECQVEKAVHETLEKAIAELREATAKSDA